MREYDSVEAQVAEAYQRGRYQEAAILANQRPFLCPNAP